MPRVTANEIESSTAAQPIASAAQMARQRRELDQSLWAPEVTAQEHERVFVDLWDTILNSPDKASRLTQVPFVKMLVGTPQKPAALDWGIRQHAFSAPSRELTTNDWKALVAAWTAQGYQLLECEWHHAKFQPATDTQGARSVVGMLLHVIRDDPRHRAVIRGDLHVEWSHEKDILGMPVPGTIRVENLTILDRPSEAAFEEILTVDTTGNASWLLPLIVRDLDGDGLSEIIAGGLNVVYRNQGGGKFKTEPLLTPKFNAFDAAIVADFTGEGHVDLVCIGHDQHATLFRGNEQGRFESPGTRCAEFEFELPKSFTCGDIDGDGDLDLFIGQYKFPYVQGTMPTPFYDANDGFPAVLLQNDGQGKFTDVTQQSGLTAKRHRRMFSSSLVDLDDDGDLDLLAVSDFAGVDFYENDGTGRFTDVTETWVDEPKLFGMSHTFGDFDLDGQLDIYAIGMSSTTARRLESLQLARPDHPQINRHRAAMSYGNRMYLRRGSRYEQPTWRDQVARSGWSWGSTSFDFDNDGDRDIYVVNGHQSGTSTQDYCTRFWCHDIYTEGTDPDPEREKLFNNSLRKFAKGTMSWNGYEHNVLLMNHAGRGFKNIGFLFDVASEMDGRSTVSEDLDGDGRVDLIVVDYKANGPKTPTFYLHVLRNRLETGNHWIGVRLRGAAGKSPIGAKVSLQYSVGKQIARVVTGDSFSAQHSTTVHFGLGTAESVDWIEVQWADGNLQRIERPEVDTYHWLAFSKQQ